MITCTMIPCIKYISPALVFNKIFLKLYSILVTILFLIQTSWFYIDLILNRYRKSRKANSKIDSLSVQHKVNILIEKLKGDKKLDKNCICLTEVLSKGFGESKKAEKLALQLLKSYIL